MSAYLPGNPYADDGMQYTAQASEHNAWNYEDRLIMATMANSFATLALAHEQRTANLIALWTEPNADITPMGGINYGNIAEQIKERLGL